MQQNQRFACSRGEVVNRDLADIGVLPLNVHMSFLPKPTFTAKAAPFWADPRPAQIPARFRRTRASTSFAGSGRVKDWPVIVSNASTYTAEVARISDAGIGGISSW